VELRAEGPTSSCPSALLLDISTGELLEPLSERVRGLLRLVELLVPRTPALPPSRWLMHVWTLGTR
jgi:hypothetical protein